MAYNIIANIISSVTGGLFNFVREPVVSTSLLMSPAIIIAEYLRDEGLGDDPGASNPTWPIYISYMPTATNSQTNTIACYDTTGIKDGRYMEGEVIQHYGVQIKVRARTHTVGWAKMEALALKMDEILNTDTTVNSNEYRIYAAKRAGITNPLGSEPGTIRNQLFTANFLVTLKRIVS